MTTQHSNNDVDTAPEGLSEQVTAAVKAVTTAIEGNPVATLLGGIAIGAALGALIPRAEREKELLAPLGARFGDAARAAIDAAKDSGRQSFADAGLGTDQLRQQVNSLVQQALAAAGEAGTAAIAAARETAKR
jgi:hypothetical protein